MANLSLPITSDPKQTLLRWGAELRKLNPLSVQDFRVSVFDAELTPDAGTLSGVVSRVAEYVYVPGYPIIDVFVDIEATLAGSAAGTISINLPMPVSAKWRDSSGKYRSFATIYDSSLGGNSKPGYVGCVAGEKTAGFRIGSGTSIATGLVVLTANIRYPVDYI